jgi:hypothetical protein
MFRNPDPVAELANNDVAVPADDPVPLSHLALDLPEPPVGWITYLNGRGIDLVDDDIGRKSISRADAWQLLDERREDEARRRELAQRREREAIEADRAFRAALPKGLHWTDIPVGVSAAQMWAQAEKDSRPRRRSVLDDALSNQGSVYHPIPHDADES